MDKAPLVDPPSHGDGYGPSVSLSMSLVEAPLVPSEGPMTAPAHDPERLARCTRITDELEALYAKFSPSETATGIIRRLREWIAQGAPPDPAHDQARGPTVPTRTASGYRNQAAPDE